MGNGQSHIPVANSTTTILIDTPSQPATKPPPRPVSTRPSNKLSKPRTNNSTSTNLLNLSTVSIQQRNSISQQNLDERPSLRRRFSVASIDTIQLGMEKAEKEKKRREQSRTRRALGLFRRRSVQAQPEILATGANNHAEILETDGLEMQYSRHNSMPNRERSGRFRRRNTMGAPVAPTEKPMKRHSRNNSVANSIAEEPSAGPSRRCSRRSSIAEEMAGDPMRRYSRHNSFTKEHSFTINRRFSRRNSVSDPDPPPRMPLGGQSSATDPDLLRRYSRGNLISHEGVAAEQSYSSPVLPTGPDLAQPNPLRASPIAPYLPVQGRLSSLLGSSSPKPMMQPAAPDRRASVLPQGGESLQALPDRDPCDEEPLFVPIRRRSLLQPGIATRAGNSVIAMPEPPTPKASLLLSESPNVDRTKTSENSGKSMSSTLGTLVSLALAKGKFIDIIKDRDKEKSKSKDNERFRVLGLDLHHEGASTPSDLEYRHIGGYKFGTLRVTNGAATPASLSEDEYFPAAGTAEKSNKKKGTKLRDDALSVESGMKPWAGTKRPESPLRQVVSEADVTKMVPPKVDLKIITTLAAPETTNEAYELEGSQSPNKAQELAHEYMQDLPLSPFSFDTSPRASPMLRVQATSKHTAAEDHLFDMEEVDAVSKSYEDGYQAGIAAALAWQAQAAKNASLAQQPELSKTPLSKADSGYSSNTSLRSSKSLSQTPASRESPPSPLRESITIDNTEMTASVAYSSQAPSTVSDHSVRPKRTSPSRPVEGELRLETLQELTRRPPPVPLKGVDDSTFSLQEFEQAHAQLIPAVVSKRSTIHLAQLVKSPAAVTAEKVQSPQVTKKSGKERKTAYRQSLPATIAMESLAGKTSLDSDISLSSDGSGSRGKHTNGSKWRPAKKGRSDSQASIKIGHAIQAFPASAVEKIDIPPVNSHASRNQAKRASAFPATNYSKQIDVRKKESKETLGTIFSVGSLEERPVSITKIQTDLTPTTTGRSTPTQPHVADLINEKGRQTPPLSRRSVIPMGSKSVLENYIESPVSDSFSKRKSTRDLRANVQSGTKASPDASRSQNTHHAQVPTQPKNPYDLFLSEPAEPAYRALTKEQRTKSMTSKLELEAAAKSAESRRKSVDEQARLRRQPQTPVGSAKKSNEDQAEQEPPSQPIAITTHRRSSSSISSFGMSQSLPSVESPMALMNRLSARVKRNPPQVHKTRSTYVGLGIDAQAEAEVVVRGSGSRTASMTSVTRVRSPPPVSLIQLRKFSAGQIRQALAPTPSLPPTPLLDSQAQMSRLPSVKASESIRNGASFIAPLPSQQQQPQPASVRDIWAGPRNNSRQRRQSSGEALSYQLKARESAEYISTLPQQPQQQMHARSEHVRQPQRSSTMDALDSRHRLSTYRSFDTSQRPAHLRQSHHAYTSQSYHGYTSQPYHGQSYIDPYYQGAYVNDQYDHTYGSAPHHQQQEESTYYEAADESQFVDQSAGQFGSLPPPRSTSTSDMFINPLEVGLGDDGLAETEPAGRRGGEFGERPTWGRGVSIRG
ncbi:hypothetical protein F5884DRAFT_748219 [Xylogone sp. PMI_703]|nr:hypothetical protein F5884DRAFT_748219 [Xylogone sp. PMI_703]